MEEDLWEVTLIRWRSAWERAGRAESTIDTYINGVVRYGQWCREERKQTSSLVSAELYVDHVRRSRSQHAARSEARALKAFGKFWAEEFGDADPYAKLRLPKEPEPSSRSARMATQEDLAKLLATCNRSTFVGERDYAIITMLANTGMRRSEVINLRLEDADLARQTIFVRTGKNAAARRTIHMTEELQGVLLKYLRKREAKIAKNRSTTYEERATSLFITEVISKPNMTPNGATQMLRKRGKAAGVDVRAHSFRRWHASRWLAAGGSETGLMANSGWTSSVMVARYTRDAKEQNAQLEAARLFG